MGLGLALSGISNGGHDVGGFAGPSPDPELFARWVEMGVFMPRFSIHSWNDDGSVNAPWMHPSVAGQVGALMRLRVRIQPYLHYLSWRYARDFEPIWRPPFHDFPSDPACWEENDEFMLGASLLIAPVVEPGAVTRTVRPPAGAQWIDPWTGTRHLGGRSVELAAPLGRPAFLARAGSIVPTNLATARFGDETLQRGFMIFPLDEGEIAIDLFDDDGESVIDVAEARPWGRIEIQFGGARIKVTLIGPIDTPIGGLLLPPGERRPLVVERS
jgi:alpha-glucosidase